MTGVEIGNEVDGIELDFEISEPPQKVWRALSIPEFREKWLPTDKLAEPLASRVVPGRELCYQLREDTPPFLESTVTFRISPSSAGGTRLRIIHRLNDAKAACLSMAAANSNTLPLKMSA
nr:hypothetical protein [uncultured Roseibium sp.]